MSTEALHSATFTLSLSGAIRDPVFDHSSAVSMDSIRYLGPVADGEYVSLADLSGDLDVARELLASNDRVLRYDVAGTDDRGVVYAHFRSVGPIGDFLTTLYDTDVVLDWPIEHRQTRDEHEVRFTVVGTRAGIRRVAGGVPDVVDVSVERIGRYRSRADASPPLTDTQAALLDLAIEEGYYEVPRETSQRALAERLGVAPGTVADRLQRIERRVMTAYATDSRG
jgi:hypothetical protein